jgi:hypothetical protein
MSKDICLDYFGILSLETLITTPHNNQHLFGNVWEKNMVQNQCVKENITRKT